MRAVVILNHGEHSCGKDMQRPAHMRSVCANYSAMTTRNDTSITGDAPSHAVGSRPVCRRWRLPAVSCLMLMTGCTVDVPFTDSKTERVSKAKQLPVHQLEVDNETGAPIEVEILRDHHIVEFVSLRANGQARLTVPICPQAPKFAFSAPTAVRISHCSPLIAEDNSEYRWQVTVRESDLSVVEEDGRAAQQGPVNTSQALRLLIRFQNGLPNDRWRVLGLRLALGLDCNRSQQ